MASSCSFQFYPLICTLNSIYKNCLVCPAVIVVTLLRPHRYRLAALVSFHPRKCHSLTETLNFCTSSLAPSTKQNKKRCLADQRALSLNTKKLSWEYTCVLTGHENKTAARWWQQRLDCVFFVKRHPKTGRFRLAKKFTSHADNKAHLWLTVEKPKSEK
jgi:hypothetical protein